MRYIVEACTSLVDVCDRSYRLQRDNSWRPLNNGRERLDSDKLFPWILDTSEHIERGRKINLNGDCYIVNPRARIQGENYALVNPKIFRSTKPRLFNFNELRYVIQHGDDLKANCLILDTFGEFNLIDYSEAINPLSPVAVRYQTFPAGNDMVGEKASKDRPFVSMLYKSMLAGWINHLETGNLRVYAKDIEGLNCRSDLLREKANRLVKHLR